MLRYVLLESVVRRSYSQYAPRIIGERLVVARPSPPCALGIQCGFRRTAQETEKFTVGTEVGHDGSEKKKTPWRFSRAGGAGRLQCLAQPG